MVNFMLQLLSPQDKMPQLPIDYETVWVPQGRSGLFEKEKKFSIWQVI
jgi:hypothetical protein